MVFAKFFDSSSGFKGSATTPVLQTVTVCFMHFLPVLYFWKFGVGKIFLRDGFWGKFYCGFVVAQKWLNFGLSFGFLGLAVMEKTEFSLIVRTVWVERGI
jgi:hypothetical protein